MKNATEMKIQNSDAFGVGALSVTEVDTEASTTLGQNTLVVNCSVESTQIFLNLIEEAEVFTYFKNYGAGSEEDFIALGILDPSEVICRLQNIGLPILTLSDCDYLDRNGDKKFSSRVYQIDEGFFSHDFTSLSDTEEVKDGK